MIGLTLLEKRQLKEVKWRSKQKNYSTSLREMRTAINKNTIGQLHTKVVTTAKLIKTWTIERLIREDTTHHHKNTTLKGEIQE